MGLGFNGQSHPAPLLFSLYRSGSQQGDRLFVLKVKETLGQSI